MHNAISWFDIPTPRLDAAQVFYEAVLGHPMRREAMGASVGAVFAYDPQSGTALPPGMGYFAHITDLDGKDKVQAFVSIGVVEQGEVYPFDMGGGFVPAVEAPIAPLLDALEFVEDRSRWGYPFRFGLFAVSDTDMSRIAHAVQADDNLLCF